MKYTKERLEEAARKSKSVANVLRLLGVSPSSGGMNSHIKSQLKKFGISTLHFTGQGWRPKGKSVSKLLLWKEVLMNGRLGDRKEPSKILRRALIESGVRYICEQCQIVSTWNGKSLRLEIDHKNGNNLDNSKENLRFLCPNCHSQTDTFRAKNIRAPMMELVDKSDLKSDAAIAA